MAQRASFDLDCHAISFHQRGSSGIIGRMKMVLENKIAKIQLDNEPQGNSLGLIEVEKLETILDELCQRTNLTGIILSSRSDRFFCTGGNLTEQAVLKNRNAAAKYHRQIRKSLLRLEKIKFPVVAIVDGLCLGGGIELLSCADYIIATPSATFGFWQRKIGLTFGWGGGARLLKRTSGKTLNELTLTARAVSALEAQSLDLVDEVVPKAFTQERAEDWLNKACAEKFVQDELIPIWKSWSVKFETKIFESLLWKKKNLQVLKSRRKK